MNPTPTNAELADAQPPDDAPKWAYNAARKLGGEHMIFERAHIIYGAFLRRALPDPALTPPHNPQATPDAAQRCLRIVGDTKWQSESDEDSIERFRAIIEENTFSLAEGVKLTGENAKLRAELAAAREALQSIADEANTHHEHNPVSGVDRLPLGYCAILVTATAALNPQPGAKG